MSTTSPQLTFSTISSPVTQTRVVEVTSQSSSSQLSSSSAYSPSNPYPSPDPNQNPNPDPFNTGPSVYLYGFLATLVLIFAVSIGVAWRGYYTRRLLRARIEEALARGVPLPGYTGEYPYFGGGQPIRLGPRPVIYDAWMDTRQEQENSPLLSNAWDLKPASLDLLRPASPTPDRKASQRHSSTPLLNTSSFLHQLLSSIREFWFVPPPEGAHPGQLQGRSAQSTSARTSNARDTNEEEEEGDKENVKWEGAQGVALSVLIAMPNPERPTQPAWDGRGKGKGRVTSRPTSYFVPGRSSTSETRERAEVEEEGKDLPELVLGYTEASLPNDPRAVGE